MNGLIAIAMRISWMFSMRASRKQIKTLRKSTSANDWRSLENAASEASQIAGTLTAFGRQLPFYISPEAMICHPLLVHYIRPAQRVARKAGFEIRHIPVIASPVLRFGGQARRLEQSELVVAEIPLGLILLLREIGRAVLTLHNAIQYETNAAIPAAVKACRTLSNLLQEEATQAFKFGQEHLETSMTFKSKSLSALTSMNFAMFVILHEIGHVCQCHDLDGEDEELSRQQEYEADAFSMRCLLRSKESESLGWSHFSEFQFTSVCELFILFELHYLRMSDSFPSSYPTFADRRRYLYSKFDPPGRVLEAVQKFYDACVQTSEDQPSP